MIDTDLAISPLPPRLISEILKSSNRTNVEDHVIFKVLIQNSTFQSTPQSDEVGYKKFNKKRTRLQPLKTLYPEILVVLDASIYK